VNQYLKNIQDILQQVTGLPEQEKLALLKALADADKQWTITDFKLDRTEKVKKTTAILLEETIQELELKRKAVEDQNRELEVESALERVRTAAMAMKKPSDMVDICRIIAEQLELLGVKDIRNVQTAIFYPDRGTYINFEYYARHKLNLETEVYYVDHSMSDEFANRMLKGAGEFFSRSLTGKELKDWYEFQKTTRQFVDSHLEVATSLNYYWYSLGPVALGISTYVPLTETETNLFNRFRNVFELAYRRYLDIEKAEAQAREAQVEAALERVRSRTLAMQRSDELAETAAVLFRQLIQLGIEPNRLYICIINDEQGDSEFWITDEDGTRVSSAFTANLNDNLSLQKMFQGWKEQKKSFIIDMQGKELQDYFEYLLSLRVPFKGGLEQKRRIQHLAYFSKGFIGMASPDEQPAETLLLLERFASVFNLTFTRFNDLKLAEAHALQAEQDLIEIKAAKKKAEEALTELQATQKQLIHSEKMASLGELTAGIAHEIQNPLNFVNNFSELNSELIDELVNEADKGNTEEVKAIARDIAMNMGKINHHGKRADAIVKGMLQHSRTSTGQKEPTDINSLCDEYLRLAFHGLRAKDKTFNAKFETQLDPSIGKINVLPQDLGRVILNLINNAFYAASQASHQTTGPKVPVVIVTTKLVETNGPGQNKGVVEIRVTDNGPGIPEKIREKIFQPFFTTKPTGEGTGLGLSLSYDIVTKGHGGDLLLETKEGEGSTFIVRIPI
jgi:signal transduction histidine kinase